MALPTANFNSLTIKEKEVFLVQNQYEGKRPQTDCKNICRKENDPAQLLTLLNHLVCLGAKKKGNNEGDPYILSHVQCVLQHKDRYGTDVELIDPIL